MTSLGRTATNSVYWTAISAGLVTVVQFVEITMLARLLTVEQFGLTAMVAVVLGFVQTYTDLGISNAIIYHQDIKKTHLSSLYWLNWLMGGGCYLILAAVTPLVAIGCHEPRLYPLLLLSGLVLLISPLGQQFRILLQKNLSFRILAIVECSSSVLGCVVATIAAFAAYGAYSIIFGQLAATIYTAAYMLIVGWKRWPPTAHFQWTDIRGYLRFGFFQIGERSINYLGARMDQLIIGLLLGSVALGYYALAWNIAIQPLLKLNPVITRIAFPLFSKIQSETARLKHAYLTVQWIITATSAPILMGVAVVSMTLIPVVFGTGWMLTAQVLQIVALVGLSKAIGNPVGSLLLSQGRADLGFYWNALLLVVQVPVLYLGVRLGGLKGAAWAVLLLQLSLAWPMYVYLIRPLLGPCAKEYFRDAIAIPSLCGLVMIIAVHFVPRFNIQPVPFLTVQICFGGITYAGLFYCVQRKRITKMLQTMIGSVGIEARET